MSKESWVIHHLLVKYLQNGIISQKFLTNFVHSNHYFSPSATRHHKGFSLLAHCLSSEQSGFSRSWEIRFKIMYTGYFLEFYLDRNSYQTSYRGIHIFPNGSNTFLSPFYNSVSEELLVNVLNTKLIWNYASKMCCHNKILTNLVPDHYI